MSIPFSMFGVGDRISDNVLEEDLENTTGLFVDKTGDTLYTATTSETTDSLCCISQPEYISGEIRCGDVRAW